MTDDLFEKFVDPMQQEYKGFKMSGICAELDGVYTMGTEAIAARSDVECAERTLTFAIECFESLRKELHELRPAELASL